MNSVSSEEIDRLIRRIDHRSVRKITPLSGGDIHQVYLVEFEEGQVVLKVSGSPEYSFSAEAQGLREISRAGAIRTPKVLSVSKTHICMEYIKTQPSSPQFFVRFGRELATLHRSRAAVFGFENDNFIGKLVQKNTPTASLAEFFAECRFRHIVSLGRAANRVSDRLASAVDRLCEKLPELFAPLDEAPALLHGDLWNGNYLASAGNEPILIDPAVYYGPREADIAMTKMFGGFPKEFYTAYNEAYPMASGWEERIDLFNLYHLLTHAVMFGGGYGDQALRVAKRYLG